MRYLTLLFAISLCAHLSGQDYEQFIQPQHRWMVSWDLNSTIWDADYFYENVFGADTLINDTLYTIVWRNHYARTGEEGGFETIIQPFEPGYQNELIGFVREDTLAQRVYFRSEDALLPDQDFLLYDFNLQVGDIIYDDLVGSGPYQVTQVNTQFLYGEQRRVWTLDSGRAIIEGVGSDLGPFEGITDLISGGFPELYQFCDGPAMDCHVAVDGLVNNRRQINIRYTIPDSEGPYTYQMRAFRFVDTVHFEGHVFWELSGPGANGEEPSGIYYRQNGSKVYRYHPAYDSEVILLFDFELPGPSYTYYGYRLDDFSIFYDVVTPYTYELSNGEVRNSIYLYSLEPQAPWQQEVHWVEGIGDIRNPLFPEEYLSPLLDIGNSELVCFYDDYEEEAIHLNPLYENCSGDLVNSTGEALDQEIKLHPNPSTGLVYLQPPAEGLQIVLFDLFGRKLSIQTATQAIDLTDFPSGTYIYHIIDQQGLRVGNGKLIKQ